MTNADLRYWYKYFNKRFFRNRLPAVPIRFSHLPGNLLGRTVFGQEIKTGAKWFTVKVLVSKKLKPAWADTTAVRVILHEMSHISIGRQYGHGKRFWNEIDRLYKAGAYTKVRGGVL